MSVETGAVLVSMLKTEMKLWAVRPEDALADLGLDSLSLLRLSLELERRFGVRLPARGVLRGDTTVAQLADWIESKRVRAGS